jgi:hypothetical protein
MTGIVACEVWRARRGIWVMDLRWERRNLIVNGAAVPRSKLLGGDVTDEPISIAGFGSGSAQPLATDTVLTAPAYYNAIASHSYPQAGQVQFNWALTNGVDTGAYGMTFWEMGLFANTGGVALPVAQPSGSAPNITMIAHLLLPASIAYASGVTVTGTWTLTA